MYYFTPAIKQEVGQNISKARKQRKQKQADVAEAAGLNASYYGKIERGLVNPSLEKIYRIIKALEIKSSDVFPF
jgi:transcriptional regulator with XRE-family HTH domain